jgi:D-alanine-D-alanine ligase
MPESRVLILYNEPVLPVGHPDFESECDILNTVDAVNLALADAGFEVNRLGVGKDVRVLLDGLSSWPPDVVFNLFEGIADHGQTEAYVAGLLEWSGVPFTGSPAEPLVLARSKHLAKYLFQGAGLPTPPFCIVEKPRSFRCSLDWPVIVKPASEDGSAGLDQGSVVTNETDLDERIAHLLAAYGPPILVEEFIEGRELNVAWIEGSQHPKLIISEIIFADASPGYWPIVTYDAKWRPRSYEFKATPPRSPADVSPELARQLQALAQNAFRLLGCRDYARADFRVRPPGEIYLLEVNPNPDFSPSAGLAGGLSAIGIPYAQFAVDLVRAALARSAPVWRP